MIESDITVGTALRITCTKDELVQGLSLVGRAVSSRTAIQILSGILLEAGGDELRLAATDMELSLRAAVPARVEGDGAVVLPGRTLVDIARLLPGDDVTIEHRASESVVHVVSGSASYTLHTYNAEDFPRLPDLDEAQTFTVDREALLETIARVARAASRDEARPVLTGVLVQFVGDKLVMAATDSSLPKIGKEFGGRDHTTVIHATSKISRLIREDRSVYNLVQELTARVKQVR